MRKVRLNNGEEVGFEEFIARFSKAYCRDSTKEEGVCYSQSDETIELKILSGSCFNRREFARMLAWKIGKIRPNQEGNDGIIYYKDWLNCEKSNPQIRGREFQLQEYFDRISSSKEILALIDKDDVEGCINCLMSCKVRGIGPVYSIAVLFFLSKGKYPIYDRFVKTALDVLYSSDGKSIPKRGDSAKCGEVNPQVYLDFRRKMDSLYKELYPGEEIDYIKNRELDRALWVYGHGFIS